MSDPNPKDAAGRAKLPLHLWPPAASALGSLGLLEGALKYGRNNWRATPVYASIYVAAAKRHLDAWFDGQDTAPDTGVPHLGNALACLAILVDAEAHGTLIDDRNFVPGATDHGYDNLTHKMTPLVTSLQRQFADRDPKQWDARDNK